MARVLVSDFSLEKERIIINVSQDFVSGKVINAILKNPLDYIAQKFEK